MAPRFEQSDESGKTVEAVRRRVRAAVAVAPPVPSRADGIQEQQKGARAAYADFALSAPKLA